MSKADDIFISTAKDIIENGTSTKGQKVRPHWEDGSPAYTIKKFGYCAKYDLREEFPAMTLRQTYLKSAMDEILWIYQKKSNDINDLKSNIWNEWADSYGTIGKAYGYQVAEKYVHHVEKISYNGILKKYGSFKNYYEASTLHNCKILSVDPVPGFFSSKLKMVDTNTAKDLLSKNLADLDVKIFIDNIYMDQMDAVLYDLKNNPFSRRIMINLWNNKELHEMQLQPCCYNVIFNVTDEGGDKLVLNMTLNQRSNDMLTANNWNIAQYAIFLMMVAQCVDMIPGQIMHCITDIHIYDRHIALVKGLIERETYPAPKVSLNPEVKDFYKFTTNDLIIEDYEYGPQIKNIPIAI